MLIFNCHKQEPQPWMSYISPAKICFSGGCCPSLVTQRYCEGSGEITYISLDDIYIAETGAVTTDSFAGSERLFSQSFNLTETSYISSIAFKQGSKGGTPDMDIRLSIYTSLNDLPINKIEDSLNVLSPEDWQSGSGGFDNIFNFNNTELIAGNYCMVISYENVTTHNDANLISIYSNNGSVYSNGKRATKTGAAAWVVSETTDLVAIINRVTPIGGECWVSLLPFQIISEGDYVRSEISDYGSGVWTEITLPITSVVTEGFYIHSYDGSTLAAELDCGAYEFRVTAGEMWWFEPFTVEEFEFYENAYHKRDLLMLPFKFSDLQFETLPLIAPCDSFLPFMFTTENATSGTPTYTLVSLDGTETALTITVDVLTIDGRTYYIHDGECFYPFLECGRYYVRIDDGSYSYFSAWFDAVCEMNDIPDGSRAMRDANGCVMRDELGEILTEPCTDVPEDIIYGLLYNWYAVDDVRDICASGWHVPSKADFETLVTYLGGDTVAGGKLKEMGLIYWETPNTGATNEVGFNARGTGQRSWAGEFVNLLRHAFYWTTTVYPIDPTRFFYMVLYWNNATTYFTNTNAQYGRAIRLVKDSTSLTHGQLGIYIGNDGKVYRTICVGIQEWLSSELAETMYSNGDHIPEETDNATFFALTTGAMCAYNNDWNNVQL